MLQANQNPNPYFLAIGESTEYYPSPYWTLVDIKDSDINVDFENINYKLNKNLKNIYSSHCIEHLSDEAINYLFKQISSNMGENSVFRLETPDVEKIIKDYKLKKIMNILKRYNLKTLKTLF